ncbi:MAG: COG3014 family protein [Marinobacter sp.]
MKAIKRVVLTLGMVAFVSGCSSFQQRNQMASFNSAYSSGDYDSALNAVSFNVGEGKEVDSESHLLELLHQGEMYRLTGRYDEAAKVYDLAEEGMKYLDQSGLLENAAEGFMAVMVNDAERDYEALMSEAVLVNTYKGLAFLAAGNTEYARIEFNRANDRTRRAVDYFQEEIAEQQAELEKEAQDEKSKASMVRNSLENEEFQSAISDHYGAASSWSVFPEFIVPSSTYLHGMYFLANAAGGADYERAATSLKRVAKMSPDSAVLKADADLATNLASGKQRRSNLPPQVWVVYENGLGPVLEETRFDVPLLLFQQDHQSLGYFGIALPRYAERAAVPGTIGMIGDAGEVVHTERISDMGTVIRTEMKERFAGVLTRAVTSAVIKAVIQNEAAGRFGVIGQLGAAALTAATTRADLRGWQAMPNHWQAARIDRPESGKLTLVDNLGDVLGNVNIPQQPFTLVYVKRPTILSPATVITMDLQGGTSAAFARLPEQPAESAQVSSIQ